MWRARPWLDGNGIICIPAATLASIKLLEQGPLCVLVDLLCGSSPLFLPSTFILLQPFSGMQKKRGDAEKGWSGMKAEIRGHNAVQNNSTDPRLENTAPDNL